MKKSLTAPLLLAASMTTYADTWTGQLHVTLVEPLLSWNSGAIRVVVDANVNASPCGTTTIFDFLYSGGTSESRASIVSALYMALAADKTIRLYYADTCSPWGTPVITGMDVLR
jgi:hypothetical protein